MRKVSILKVVLVITMAIFVLSVIVPQVCSAYDWNLDSLDNTDDMGGIKNTTTNIVGVIVDVVRIVALGVAIIMLAFVAMKYMSSAPGDRAEIKKHAIVYVVGAIVLFGSSGILTIIKSFAGSIGGGGDAGGAAEE